MVCAKGFRVSVNRCTGKGGWLGPKMRKLIGEFPARLEA